MGRGRGAYMGKKGRGKPTAPASGEEEQPANKKPRVDWDSTSYVTEEQKHNQAFEEYYIKNDIVPVGEWGQFLEALRKPLPVTFRINGSGRFADHLRDKLQSDFFSQFGGDKLEVDGEPLESPKPLPWYPNNYAWHMNFSRNQLRKVPLLKAIHEFMKKANDNGSISRQEAVSMVPPLFLDVQPSHRVLDMCAAPGSKTFQLLEALHAGNPADDSSLPEVDRAMGTPQGYVVANDADLKRCSLLTHQVKRVCSPCLVVTNHSAEMFPQMREHGKLLRYHRVLCDVPCSGDGTMRKAPDIWRRWTVNNGNGLHMMQLRIAVQGVKLLEVGGRMVYSTCTFNPIEDEAVVAEVLVRCKGAVELVDPEGMLPLLKRMEGKRTWHVRDGKNWLESYEQAQAQGITRVEPSMFPSPEKAQLPLHRCMRFLPHHQDTGGFFVAVLQKVSELPPNMEAPRSMAKPTGKAAKSAGPKAEAEASKAEAQEGQQASTEAPAAAAAAAAASAPAPQGDAAAPPAGDAVAPPPAASAAESDAAKPSPTPPAEAEVEPAAAAAAAAAAATGAPTASAATTTDAATDAAAATGAAAAAAGTSAAAAVSSEPSWVRGQGGRGRVGGMHAGIDPIVPVESPEILKSLSDFYGIAPDSPLLKLLLSRSMEQARPKRLNVVSSSLMAMLKADVKEQLKIIATGLKLFDRQELKEPLSSSNCAYRVSQEGVSFLLPHITRQRVQLGLEDFLGLLRDRYISFLPPPPAPAPAEHATAAPAPQGEGASCGSAAGGDEGNGAAAAATAATAAECGEGGAAAAEAAAQQAEGEAQGAPGSGEAVSAQQAGEEAARVREQTPWNDGKGGRQQRKEASKDTLMLEALKAMLPGCVVAELKMEDAQQLGLASGQDQAGTGALAANAPLALSAWKGKATLAIMADRAETAQMIDKIEAARTRLAGKSAL